MSNKLTEDMFLHDVKDHAMEIIRDNGVDRHIRFRQPGTSIYGFDLITWPGHLCITGDCGTYVFSRIHDMFGFFRQDEEKRSRLFPEKTLLINPRYWHEKVLSADRSGGIEEFSPDLFESAIRESFEAYFEDGERQEHKDECWEVIDCDVLQHSHDGAIRAYDAAIDFHHEPSGFRLTDFWDIRCNEYTYHFLWNLYAIVWGIGLYDYLTNMENYESDLNDIEAPEVI